MYYLLDINDLNVVENNDVYNFLEEMRYYNLKYLYQQLYYYQNISNAKYKKHNIDRLQDEINTNLSIAKIPRFIIVERLKDNKFIDIFTDIELELSPSTNVIPMTEQELFDYSPVITQENIKYLSDRLPKFKEKIKKIK